ncbi:MAG: hypothetical protein E6959_04095 [Eikenella corrodens]|nr:hypothetical protein [Eikenella corrodens]
MQTEICHIANVKSFEDWNTNQESTVGRIWKHRVKIYNQKRNYYLIEMIDGRLRLCADELEAFAVARNFDINYFIEPV